MNAKAIVFGATGYLGSHICETLVKKDYDVTAFVRTSSDKKPLSNLNIRYKTGDLLNDGDVFQISKYIRENANKGWRMANEEKLVALNITVEEGY